jgi:translation elongation factor EF-Ts
MFVVKAAGSCTLARIGAMVTLKKINKIAPAREFCDQLCEHILATKPSSLGDRTVALEQQKLKTNQRDAGLPIHHHELLCQTYIFDPTINVAEAARRSFVEVKEFVLFE